MAQLATLTVKLQAQIAEFQADFKEAAKSTEKFQTEFQGVATKASAYGNLIARGVELGVEAIKNLGKSILENASNITDLSAKTGLAMRTIQQFQSVAAQTGTTVDAFADAAFKLGANLAGGNKSIVNAVEDLGLAFSDLRAQSPDQQFDAITDALGRMEDPQERNRLGLILFGRTFKEIAPAVAEGYKDMADKASISSDEQIRAIDKTDDAWKRFKQNALTNATSFAGGIILRTEEVDAAVEKMGGRFDGLRMMMPGNVGAMADYLRALRDVREEADNFSLSKVVSEMQRIALLKLKPGELGPAILKVGTSEYDAIEKDLNDSIKRQNASWDKGRAAVDAYQESVKRLRDELSGANLQAEVKKLEDAFRGLTEAQKDQPDIMRRTGEAAERLREDGAKLSPELLTLAVRTESFSKWLTNLPGQTEQWARSFDALRKALDRPLVQLADLDVALRQIQLAPTTGLPAGEMLGTKVDLSNFIPAESVASVVNPFREAFTNFGQELPNIIFGALQSGHSVVGAVATGLASEFTRVFAERVAEAAKNDTELSGSSKAIGVAGLGLSSLLQGYGFGESFGKGKGALAGAGAGAVAGIPLAAVTGGLSIAVGAIAGAIGGWLGGMKKAKEQLAELREAQLAVLQEFGGFDALKAKADEFGISLGNALTTKNPAEFTRVMEQLGAAIDAQKIRIEGFGIAVEGINTKAALFAVPFDTLIKAREEGEINLKIIDAKLAETGQRGQAEFERIGTFAAAAFAGMVKESGDAVGAIRALEPTLVILQRGLDEFGLTSTGTIDSLLGMFSFVNDAVTGPIFASIQATGQIFEGLTKGGLVTKDIFQLVATDIGASFKELERKGGDVATAMALSQPILQKLWEGQKLYGTITDETTQSILKQAEEQGLVGDHMKDVNQKILDVLIAIADVFGAKIPDAFRETKKTATQTAKDIEADFTAAGRGIQSEFDQVTTNIRDNFNAAGRGIKEELEDNFRDIRISPIKVPIEYVDPGWSSGRSAAPLASGGIVRRPTLALIGEAGPEAVIPLNQLGSVAPQGGTSTVIFEVAGQRIARATVPYLPGEIRRYVPA